jgi:uncharacterized membrane protein
MLWIAIVSRWVHIGSAIVLVGGLVFLRFVLGPAAKQLPDDAHETLKALVLGKWKMVVHAGFGLFWISGLYNYLVVMRPLHSGDKIYHMLLGIKILLALIVTFLSIFLVGRSKVSAGMRANPQQWQGIILLLAALIIGISGYAKVALKGTAAAPVDAVTNL